MNARRRFRMLAAGAGLLALEGGLLASPAPPVAGHSAGAVTTASATPSTAALPVVEQSGGAATTTSAAPSTAPLVEMGSNPSPGVAGLHHLPLLAAGQPPTPAPTPLGNLEAPDVTAPVAVPVSAAQFGYNMQGDFDDPAADAAAVAGGASIVRWQPAWSNVESYSTGALALSPGDEAALRYFAAHGVRVIAVCAYGPPFGSVEDVTVATAVGSGSYTIALQSAAGIQTPTDYVEESDGTWINAKSNYPGALIASVSGNSITLASALTVNLSAGTVLKVNRNRYPAVATTSPDDPSVVAYFRYLQFVADRMSADGVTGWVALWNETPWADDLWDEAGSLYDQPPKGINLNEQMHSFLQYALGLTMPPGIHIINDASDKTGFSGVLWQGLPVTPTTVADNVSVDSIHPYGNVPEQQMWDVAEASGTSYAMLNPTVDSTANFPLMAYADYHSGTGLGVMATETGSDISDDNRQAVDLVRRVAAGWGAGVPSVIYALNEGSSYDVMNSPTSPRLSYTVLQRLAGQVGQLSPGGSASEVPTGMECDWSGHWPPYAVAVYGANGVVLLVWQRTGYDSTTTWSTVPTPATYQCVFTLPGGATVRSATDLVTGNSVPVATSGTTLTLGAVGEDVQAIDLS